MDSISPATVLLEKRKELYETQEALEKEKDTFRTKEAIFKRKENELRERDLKIQESLIKFSKYLETNDIKKKKAEEKRDKENDEINHLETEISALTENLDTLKSQSLLIQNKVSEMQEYESYLKQVKEENPDE